MAFIPIDIPLRHDQISADELVEIYKLFCQSYEFEFTARDERFMRGRGINDLHDGHLEYRPFYGAKFFGKRAAGSTQFWGYTDIENLDEHMNEDELRKLVTTYVEKNLRAR